MSVFFKFQKLLWKIRKVKPAEKQLKPESDKKKVKGKITLTTLGTVTYVLGKSQRTEQDESEDQLYSKIRKLNAVDRKAIFVFPFGFMLFNIWYWTKYLLLNR